MAKTKNINTEFFELPDLERNGWQPEDYKNALACWEEKDYDNNTKTRHEMFNIDTSKLTKEELAFRLGWRDGWIAHWNEVNNNLSAMEKGRKFCVKCWRIVDKNHKCKL